MHAHKYTKHACNPSGFTLIEALVAILIFTSALIIFGTMLSRGLSSMTNARSELQAYLFAQEGIEAVHAIRDTNRNVAGSSWLDGINQCEAPANPNGCSLATVENIDASNLVPCLDTTCSADPISGDSSMLYDQSNTGPDLMFQRSITIESVPGFTDERTVTATVNWVDTSGRSRETRISEIIQNW